MQAKLGGIVVLVVLIALASVVPLSYARVSTPPRPPSTPQQAAQQAGSHPAPDPRAGQFSACPQRLRVLDRRGELADAQLFIGLPEKREELKRPRQQQQWLLAKLHKRAAAKKEGLFLQCRYKDLKDAGWMKASVTMPVPPLASACVIDKPSKGATRIRCE